MNKLFITLSLVASLGLSSGVSAVENNLSPKAALDRLMEGNKRFIQDATIGADRHQERREALVQKQAPFAIILGCSDSRVSPELAFDQGLGDLFVIRVAGNVVSGIELNSVEYSATVNHSSVIIVLGHENCGAVDAVLTNNYQSIPNIAALIIPSVEKARAKRSNHTLEDAVIDNVRNSVDRVKASPVISKLIKDKKIEVHGAYYHLSNGEITLIDEK